MYLFRQRPAESLIRMACSLARKNILQRWTKKRGERRGEKWGEGPRGRRGGKRKRRREGNGTAEGGELDLPFLDYSRGRVTVWVCIAGFQINNVVMRCLSLSPADFLPPYALFSLFLALSFPYCILFSLSPCLCSHIVYHEYNSIRR